jgi:DNA topoisomerase-1
MGRHSDIEADLEIITDPEESAKAAGLRYVSDTKPGISRKGHGEGFTYYDPDGNRIDDEQTLARIRSLAIPPAWTDVWISPSPRGHLQATGHDARGRKQYRYHPEWRKTRDQTKYNRMLAFGKALPAIRERVDQDLELPGMPREKILATVVRLLEATLIRVGNEEYAQANRSYGLTTLRNRHVDVSGASLRFRFRGKSGVYHDVGIKDRRIARIIKRCQEMPGQELFEYYDEEGEIRSIDSSDVNEYLQEITGEEFTAKDFRTWSGTVLAAMTLAGCEPCQSESDGKQKVAEAVEEVAEQLGNTPAVCRKCYIHPAVVEMFLDGTIVKAFKEPPDPDALQEEREKGSTDLYSGEEGVMRLLARYLKQCEATNGTTS